MNYLNYMNSQLRLIALYSFICECYTTELCWYCQRFSRNNAQGSITDEEIFTCYLFSIIEEEKYLVKQSYDFIAKYYGDWFPTLPSYQAFNKRLNRLHEVLPLLVSHLSSLSLHTVAHPCGDYLLDSFPVILSSGKRPNKVAQEIADKGYCASKNLYYHGVKCHLMGMSRSERLPSPIFSGITPASTHDSTPLKTIALPLAKCRIFGDKAYDIPPLRALLASQGIELITPEKVQKGESEPERQQKAAYRKIYQRTVSAVRQPIESFFNWLQEKTNIQNASKVRSKKGLYVHVFGKIAAALLILLNF